MFKNLVPEIKKKDGWTLLNQGQQEFCLSYLTGKNIFLMGSAGVGKSHVLRFLFEFLEEKEIFFGVTATAGISALNIGGSTIHSFFGLGLANTDFGHIIKGVYRNKKVMERITSPYLKTVFIDEISMCSGYIFSLIDTVLRKVRRNSLPFGGIQMVLVGDILQLPPVFKDTQEQDDFFFETPAWRFGRFLPIELTEIVRQKDDLEFSTILNQIRLGDISSIEKIKSRIGAKLNVGNGIRPVRLMGYNIAVDRYNQKVLESLEGKERTFFSKDNGEQRHIDYFNKNCQAPQVLSLKLKAQVMLVYNVNTDYGFVNGRVGQIISFEDKYPVVKFDDGSTLVVEPQKWEVKEQIVTKELDGTETSKYRVVASRTQIPLKLSWANSIHKMQGSTLDYAIIDMEQCFCDGQGYVALSRIRNLSGLSIVRDFDENKITVNKKCLNFYSSLSKT